MIWAFKAPSFGKGALRLLWGGLTLIAGVILVANPLVAAITVTVWLASYLMVDGIMEVSAGFAVRPGDGWGWLIFGGVLSIVLSFMMWGQFPLSGTYALGVFVGIGLFSAGFMMVTLSFTAPRLVGGAREKGVADGNES